MTGGDHENPVDVADVTDVKRAAMLREHLEAYVDEFGTVPRLVPLDEAGKAPITRGRCPLDCPEGRSYLVDGQEAIRRIREEGARGFAIYAGKRDHRTQDLVLVLVDVDEPRRSPTRRSPTRSPSFRSPVAANTSRSVTTFGTRGLATSNRRSVALLRTPRTDQRRRLPVYTCPRRLLGPSGSTRTSNGPKRLNATTRTMIPSRVRYRQRT